MPGLVSHRQYNTGGFCFSGLLFFRAVFLNPLEFIQFTPKSNCGECGQATCLAFAVAVTKGGLDPSRCPHLDPAGLGVHDADGEGSGLTEVDRGQEERDLALVAYLKSKIRDMDFSLVGPRLGAGWQPDEPDTLSFQYLGRAVVLSKSDVRMDGKELVDPRDQILLYNYVSFGGGEPPLNNWVGMAIFIGIVLDYGRLGE